MDIMRGELVRLAQIERDNLPSYKRWMRDYEVQRFLMMVAKPITDEFEDDWYEAAARRTDSHLFSIRTLEEDRLVGNISLHNVDARHRSAELGIVIGEKDCWNKGYGTDAIRILLRFAFDELNLHRVQLEVYSFNPRAKHVYEKVGFVLEGTRRDAFFREGAYHDVHVMSVLREDWRSRQS